MAWILPVRMDRQMLMAMWLSRVFFGPAAISPVVPTCSRHLTSADTAVPLLVGWLLACTL